MRNCCDRLTADWTVAVDIEEDYQLSEKNPHCVGKAERVLSANGNDGINIEPVKAINIEVV